MDHALSCRLRFFAWVIETLPTGCPLNGSDAIGVAGDAMQADIHLPQVNRHHAPEEVWRLTLRCLFQSDSGAYWLPDAVMQPQA